MHVLLIILAVAASGSMISQFVPTEELLQERFDLGQNYYAANDHGNAVAVFEEIEATPNYALLNVDSIQVSIGEQTLPIRVAATYQLGNSYRNVGRTTLERSRNAAAEGDSALFLVRREEAVDAFQAAKSHYRRLVEDEKAPISVREMAQYQIARANYQMGDYAGVVDETLILLDMFPETRFREAALYDRGWAYYHLGAYRKAITTFEQMLAIGSDALKVDRATFQSAESYSALGELDSARAWYRRLVDAYDFDAMTDKELKAMKTARIRGLVQETTRELVAKAQIRIADAYAREGRTDSAIAAYSLVPVRYPQEAVLVQKSYDNMATMMLEQQGVDAGIAVLRQAVEQVQNPVFRGRVQLRIARILFDAERYREALEEFRVYRRAYGDQAGAVGFSLDRVDFLMGEGYRQLAAQARANGDTNSARQAFDDAAQAYRSVLASGSGSVRLAEARYGLARAHVGLGQLDSARVHFATTVAEHASEGVAPFALNWQGRVALRRGDLEEAAAHYERVLTEYPDFALIDQARKDLGLVYKQLDLIDEALEAFGAVSESSLFWPRVQAEIGDMLLAEGRADRAGELLDLDRAAAVARERGDAEILAELLYIRGRLARERGNPLDEIAHLTEALKHTVNSQLIAFSRFFRGLAHFQAGNQADARRDTAAASAHFRETVSDLDQVLDRPEAGTMRAVAFRTRGVALTRLGRSQEAVDTYRILIDSADSPEEQAEFRLMLMELYYDQERYTETERIARELIAADFVDSAAGDMRKKERAFQVLAGILLEQERYQEALTQARRALERYPDSPERASLELVAARSLFALEKYKEAAAAFAAFVDRYPDHREAAAVRYQLGYSNEILGRYDEAAASFRKLVDRHPDHALVPDALYRAGENLYNSSRFADALKVYLRLVEQFPESEFTPKGLYSASWTYMDLEREEDSMAAMRRLVEAYPENEYARYAQFSIGDYEYSKKNYAAARAAYKRVIAMAPSTPEAEKARVLLTDLMEDLASLAYEKAFDAFNRERYQEAVAGFDSVYARYPESYSGLAALANKGVALEKLGDSDQARQAYEQVLRLAAGEQDEGDIVEFVNLRLQNL